MLCIYATGLDLETFFPRLRRVHTTAVAAAAAVLLLYLGVFVFDAVDAIASATVILNAVTMPWVVVLVIGAIRTRLYDPFDLQAFAQRRKSGRYWFTGGWNRPALIAWFSGSLFGVLSVYTDLYEGPFANILGGIDPSAIGSAVITAAVYLSFIALGRGAVDPPVDLVVAKPDVSASPSR